MLIGATLGIERRFDRRQPRAEPAQHVLDDMIAPDAQAVADNLYVDVPVADVPGEPRQLVGVGCGDFDERLRPADNTHDGAIVEHETVAVAQRRCLRQVEKKFRAALAAQNDAAAMALMRVERHGIDRVGGVPMAGSSDFARVFHVESLVSF